MGRKDLPILALQWQLQNGREQPVNGGPDAVRKGKATSGIPSNDGSQGHEVWAQSATGSGLHESQEAEQESSRVGRAGMKT